MKLYMEKTKMQWKEYAIATLLANSTILNSQNHFTYMEFFKFC